MAGYVLLALHDFKTSRADLRIALDSLIVDNPDARNQYALDTQPSAADIEKTRENMQGKVLQTDHWPQAHLTIEITGGTEVAPVAQTTLYLHGEKHSFPISFEITGLETAHLVVKGSFTMQQSDYGMQPFSILGGGLQVLDKVDVTYRMTADRVDSPAPIPAGP